MLIGQHADLVGVLIGSRDKFVRVLFCPRANFVHVLILSATNLVRVLIWFSVLIWSASASSFGLRADRSACYFCPLADLVRVLIWLRKCDLIYLFAYFLLLFNVIYINIFRA